MIQKGLLLYTEEKNVLKAMIFDRVLFFYIFCLIIFILIIMWLVFFEFKIILFVLIIAWGFVYVFIPFNYMIFVIRNLRTQIRIYKNGLIMPITLYQKYIKKESDFIPISNIKKISTIYENIPRGPYIYDGIEVLTHGGKKYKKIYANFFNNKYSKINLEILVKLIEQLKQYFPLLLYDIKPKFPEEFKEIIRKQKEINKYIYRNRLKIKKGMEHNK